MKPIVIFAATRWELRALLRALPTDQMMTVGGVRCWNATRAARPYWLIRTGIGPDNAARAAAVVLDRQTPRMVISAGFACALTPAEVGDLLVGTEVISVAWASGWTKDAESLSCDAAARSQLASAIRKTAIPAISGAVISAPTIVCRADDKRDLARMTQAVGLDMESAALGAAAARQGVPFAVVRTVSDLVDEDLPLDFNLFLQPSGWLKGARALVAHPSGVIGLNRLRKQSRMAADRLTKVFEAYADEEFGSI